MRDGAAMTTTATSQTISEVQPRPGTNTEGPKGAPARAYTLPLVHVGIPERAVDAALWASVAAAAVVGIVDAPILGVAAAGLFVVRRRHRRAG
jgi:hypothetical protein